MPLVLIVTPGVCLCSCALLYIQGAALQLLSALKSLKTLHLGGAELLLPSTPHFPVHAPPPAPRAAAEQLPHPVLTPQLSTALSLTAAATAGGSQTDMMRTLLLAKASELDQFKLQFNCCGTGVEKVRCRVALMAALSGSPGQRRPQLPACSNRQHTAAVACTICSTAWRVLL